MSGPSFKVVMSELDSLLELMLDKDVRTLKIVRDRLCVLGWPAISYCLAHVDRNIPHDRRERVRRFVWDTSSVYALKELSELLKPGPDSFYLPDGLYFLTRIMEPELSLRGFTSMYEAMADELVAELRDSMTAVEKVEMLNYFVFDCFGFSLVGGADDGHETVVLIPDIIQDRKAGVVGISMVYFLLARYAGLPVFPIFPKVPGYYVSYFDRGESLFSMDISRRGRISDPIPRRTWRNPELTGTDQTVLYLYAAAMRYFGEAEPSRLESYLLDRALETLAV